MQTQRIKRHRVKYKFLSLLCLAACFLPCLRGVYCEQCVSTQLACTLLGFCICSLYWFICICNQDLRHSLTPMQSRERGRLTCTPPPRLSQAMHCQLSALILAQVLFPRSAWYHSLQMHYFCFHFLKWLSTTLLKFHLASLNAGTLWNTTEKLQVLEASFRCWPWSQC